MKHVIKFRGKSLGNYNIPDGNWFYGYFFVRKWDGGLQLQYFILNKYGSILIDPNTLGQYIGITDANNNEIYEGDIVIRRFKNPKGTKWEKKIVVKIPDFYGEWFCGRIGDEYEVIGNIYDNPELLDNLHKNKED